MQNPFETGQVETAAQARKKDYENDVLKAYGLLIDISARPPSTPRRYGYAVVLTSFNSEYLRLLGSRGPNWADNGFFQREERRSSWI